MKTGKTIIVVTGLPGSGKSEVSSYMKSLGIPMFRTGDVIREEVLKRGLELNPQNSEMIARRLREEEGMDVASRRVGKKIKALLDGLVCVEGPRDMSEISHLAKLGRLILVIVDAPDEVRFSRQKSRKSGSRLEPASRNPKTLDEFRWRDARERERGLDEVMATRKFDKHVIVNDGTLEGLKRKVDGLLDSIRNWAG